MTAEEFLENVLAEQAVETDSDEHADLIEEHESIATLLARELPDASPGVVFLHQAEGDKERLKTNLKKHISHISESGQVDIIRLAKVWKLRSDIDIKTFILELLVIECLEDVDDATLVDRITTFWTRVYLDDDDETVLLDTRPVTHRAVRDTEGDGDE